MNNRNLWCGIASTQERLVFRLFYFHPEEILHFTATPQKIESILHKMKFFFLFNNFTFSVFHKPLLSFVFRLFSLKLKDFL